MLYWLRYARRRAREALRLARIRRQAARSGATIHPTTLLTLGRGERLALGAGVHIGEYNVIVVDDEDREDALEGCRLEVGEGTYIGAQNNIRAAGGSIRIGKWCLISQQVTLVAANHGMARAAPIMRQPWNHDRTGIALGDDVWVGANAVVLPGVRIGDGAVIAAGAVVSADVSPYQIVAGVPARVVGERT